jgi:hypothetical protein
MNTFTVGDKVRCTDADYSYPPLIKGAVYTVTDVGSDMVHVSGIFCEEPSYLQNRFDLAEEAENKPVVSDLSILKDMLFRAGKAFRDWTIHEYTTPSGETVTNFVGTVLVYGSKQDDGPYAEFVFDSSGAIIPGGARVFLAGDAF